MPLSIPDHIEVTLRICLSLVLTYILTLGSFPSIIPPSQVVIIASVTSAFTMVMPTFLFSIGAVIFPGMVMATCFALIVATILLAVAATGGVHAYVATFFVVALLISGLRFTTAGPNSALMLMLICLNTMGLAPLAETEGLSFVASLWTEKGLTNPNAVFRNSLIGMCWCSLCMVFGRLIPPFRTARCALSRKLLPKVIKDVANFIRLTVAYHIKDDIDDDDDDDGGDDDGGDNSEESSSNLDDKAKAVRNKKNDIDDVIKEVVQDGSITAAGGLATKTVLEPRIFRLFFLCSPPVDIVTGLTDLTGAVNELIFSSLTLRAFSRAGFQELQLGGLKERFLESSCLLDRCAEALSTIQPVKAADNNTDPEEQSKKQNLKYDPIGLNAKALRLEKFTKEWIDLMGPIDRTQPYFNKDARKVYISTLMPWIMGSGIGILFATAGCIRKVFTPLTWKRMCLPPHHDLPKLVWCIKFAVGFTALVIMNVYWPAFANLEVPTQDEFQSAHFAGWYLIAYAFGTTQTVEGTWKKSILRMLGTALGGFCAWLALTACKDNPYGLGAWMVVTNTFAAYLGLPKGFSSYFGLDQDLAWGPAYFSMTQALVVMEVYWGYGGKNDITVNRIVANVVGISMAMFMAAIPPGIFGGSPRLLQYMLEDKKRAFRDCIKLVLEGLCPESTISKEDLQARLHHLHAISKATFLSELTEINDNFKDANQLQSFPLLKLDPRMKLSIDASAVLGSSILALIRFAVLLSEVDQKDGTRFGKGSEARKTLEMILNSLDIEEDPNEISGYEIHRKAGEGKHHPDPVPDDFHRNLDAGDRVVPAHVTFTHFCIYLCHYIMHRETKFERIHYGFLGKQTRSNGRRTTLPGKRTTIPESGIHLLENKEEEGDKSVEESA